MHRALELALKHKSHIDTVVAHRQKYLENIGAKKETLQTFKQYSDVGAINNNIMIDLLRHNNEFHIFSLNLFQMKINWETIEAKMKAEYNKEK